jgi:hypothetical protein
VRAERRNALDLLDSNLPGESCITVGGDKGYDTRDFVEDCRERNVTPHLAQNIAKQRGSNIDERTICHVGYAISQRSGREGKNGKAARRSRRRSKEPGVTWWFHPRPGAAFEVVEPISPFMSS